MRALDIVGTRTHHAHDRRDRAHGLFRVETAGTSIRILFALRNEVFEAEAQAMHIARLPDFTRVVRTDNLPTRHHLPQVSSEIGKPIFFSPSDRFDEVVCTPLVEQRCWEHPSQPIRIAHLHYAGESE